MTDATRNTAPAALPEQLASTLTKRELFTLYALPAFAANNSPEVAGRSAVRYADAALKALQGDAEQEAKAKAEESRRADAESIINSLFGWPAALGPMHLAPLDLVKQVAASQEQYEQGHDAYARRVERGAASWPRPAWEWR